MTRAERIWHPIWIWACIIPPKSSYTPPGVPLRTLDGKGCKQSLTSGSNNQQFLNITCSWHLFWHIFNEFTCSNAFWQSLIIVGVTETFGNSINEITAITFQAVLVQFSHTTVNFTSWIIAITQLFQKVWHAMQQRAITSHHSRPVILIAAKFGIVEKFCQICKSVKFALSFSLWY